MIDRYKNLYSTLELLIVKESKEKIENSLSELEGDFYSFFSKENLEILKSHNLISEKVQLGLNLLYKIINDMDISKWNYDRFLMDDEWKTVRMVASYIKKELDRDKKG